jgi:hypothetical protein
MPYLPFRRKTAICWRSVLSVDSVQAAAHARRHAIAYERRHEGVKLVALRHVEKVRDVALGERPEVPSRLVTVTSPSEPAAVRERARRSAWSSSR